MTFFNHFILTKNFFNGFYFRISFKACKPIQEKDEITISYIPIVIGEPIRSQHIKNEWNFECKCNRCNDTNSPINEVKSESEKVKILINEAQDELRFEKKRFYLKDVQELFFFRAITSADKDCSERLEKFYAKYSHFLGQHHFLLLICTRNWLKLNPFGDFMGQDRITLR